MWLYTWYYRASVETSWIKIAILSHWGQEGYSNHDKLANAHRWVNAFAMHDVNSKKWRKIFLFFGNHSISKTVEPNDSFATWSYLSWRLSSFRLRVGIMIVSGHWKMGALESRVSISTLLISGVFVASCTVFVILFRVEETWIARFWNPNLSLNPT